MSGDIGLHLDMNKGGTSNGFVCVCSCVFITELIYVLPFIFLLLSILHIPIFTLSPLSHLSPYSSPHPLLFTHFPIHKPHHNR